jgi:hypothetical protein
MESSSDKKYADIHSQSTAFPTNQLSFIHRYLPGEKSDLLGGLFIYFETDRSTIRSTQQNTQAEYTHAQKKPLSGNRSVTANHPFLVYVYPPIRPTLFLLCLSYYAYVLGQQTVYIFLPIHRFVFYTSISAPIPPLSVEGTFSRCVVCFGVYTPYTPENFFFDRSFKKLIDPPPTV